MALALDSNHDRWRQHIAHDANHGTEVFELFTHNGVVVDDAASIVLTVRCTRIFHDDAGSVVYEFEFGRTGRLNGQKRAAHAVNYRLSPSPG